MAYIGNSPDSIQRGRRFIYEFTASAGQTVFSGTDDNNQTLDLLEANEQSVFLNGVRLIPTDDYTVSGDVLTLTSAASLNDFLVIETQAEVANISTYTRAESDARYVNYNGDIISGDLQVVGNVSVSSGDISLGDNDKINLGASNDLQLYHDGSNSYVKDAGTGNLILSGQSQVTIATDGVSTAGVFKTSAEVVLYYNNASKFQTTNTGVDVTGTVTADGLTVDGDANLSGTAVNFDLDETDTTDLNTRFRQSTGQLFLQTVNDAKSVGSNRFNINHTTGDISFYDDQGSSQSFFWDASAESLGIGTSSPSSALDVDVSQNTETNIELTNTNTGSDAQVRTKYTTDGGLFTVGKTSDAHVFGGDAYLYNVDNTNIRFATSDIERMRIAASGNVVVGGTDASYGKFSVRNGYAYINEDGNNTNQIYIRSDLAGLGPAIQVATNHPLAFRTNNLERMRITSGGNLLVGTTLETVASSSTESGVRMGDGFLQIGRSNNDILILNRQTSDGDIALFRKDGTTVGTIGTVGGDLWIGSSAASHAAIRFANGSMFPVSNTGGSSDGLVDIGDPLARFKDLYISGGVYVGGTGSANYLDDYEEGTFTPVLESSGSNPTYAGSEGGRYTKVGNIVHFSAFVDTNPYTTDGSGDIYFAGLPFTVDSSDGGGTHAINVSIWGSSIGSGKNLVAQAVGSSDYLRFRIWGDNSNQSIWTYATASIASGDAIYVQGHYYTNS